MTPSEAIRDLPAMTSRLGDALGRLRMACGDARAQWDGLAGCQREDHAAALLAPLRADLAALSTFADDCHKQIDRMVENPFNEPPDDRETIAPGDEHYYHPRA